MKERIDGTDYIACSGFAEVVAATVTAKSTAMTCDVPIRLDGVGKCFQLYDRPQDRLKQAILPRLYRAAGRLAPRASRSKFHRDFWALTDVSFEVRRGEAVAIIGRNGAGKSTLLQIIAGTLEPTVGAVEVDGRVAALLELGSGFNPELTGSENIYLNATILGLTHAQINAKFDDIAGFADIGNFIEQPIKTYSTGMVMRLAFAVQTAVEPNLLIIDEAISVGDVFFQARCMARLRSLIDSGVTILFVSHDTGTVRQLCSRALLLEGGRVRADGPASEVADQYFRRELEERNEASRRAQGPPSSTHEAAAYGSPKGFTSVPGRELELLIGQGEFDRRAAFNRAGNGAARFLNVQMLKAGQPCASFDFEDMATLRQVVRFREPLRNVNVAYKIRTLQGVDIVFGDTRLVEQMQPTYSSAGVVYVYEWTFRLALMHGKYCIMSGLAHPPGPSNADWVFIDMVPICCEFVVAARPGGMLGGFVAWRNELTIRSMESPVEAMVAEQDH